MLGGESLWSCNGIQQPVKVVPKTLHGLNPLGRSFDNLGLRLKELSTIALNQHAENLAHAPAGRSDYFQAGWSGTQQGNAAVTQDAYTVRVPIEGLELKSIQIKALQLLCGVWHGYIL